MVNDGLHNSFASNIQIVIQQYFTSILDVIQYRAHNYVLQRILRVANQENNQK